MATCCLVVAGCRGEKPAPAQPETTASEAEALQAVPVKLGPSNAAVKIVAYYPVNESHQYIVDYLKEFAEAHPAQVSLEVIDFRTPAGQKRWMDSGLQCAGVFVNGSTRHEIERNGETETADFIKRMDVFWTSEDFETVVNKLLDKTGAAEDATGGEAGESAEEGEPEGRD